MKKIPYRFLSTATPAPNDYIEFGTSSEALGYFPYMDMLTKFFGNNENNVRPQDIGTKWYLKPHAKNEFFSWLNQWSITIKKPSDLGFSDERYKLPDLIENKVFVKNRNNWVIDGQVMLFNGIAKTMSEVREEQKGTFSERCEKAVELADGKTSVYWCNFNDEGNVFCKLITKRVDGEFIVRGEANPNVKPLENNVGIQSNMLKSMLAVFGQAPTLKVFLNEYGIGVTDDKFYAVVYTEGAISGTR